MVACSRRASTPREGLFLGRVRPRVPPPPQSPLPKPPRRAPNPHRFPRTPSNIPATLGFAWHAESMRIRRGCTTVERGRVEPLGGGGSSLWMANSDSPSRVPVPCGLHFPNERVRNIPESRRACNRRSRRGSEVSAWRRPSIAGCGPQERGALGTSSACDQTAGAIRGVELVGSRRMRETGRRSSVPSERRRSVRLEACHERGGGLAFSRSLRVVRW